MKIALCGDLHIGASKHSPIIQEHQNKFFEFFFQYLNNNEITTVLQLGDFFDQRKDIHYTAIKHAREHFLDKIHEYEIDLTIIAGNHDTVYKNSNHVNSVDLLCRDYGVVIDQVPVNIPFEDCSIDFYPWINQGNLTQSIEFAKNAIGKYAIGHFEFADFPMYPGIMATHGMDHKSFSKYDRVFTGHYHTVSTKDNILYTGTPYELTWGDWNDPKGFWILDTETGSTEYIRNPNTLFEKILYTDDIKYDFSSATNKYVKIVVIEKADTKKFDAFVHNVELAKPHDLKIIEHSVKDEVDTAVTLTEVASTQTMISNVIDTIETTLDKGTLKNMFLELYSDAVQLTKTL